MASSGPPATRGRRTGASSCAASVPARDDRLPLYVQEQGGRSRPRGRGARRSRRRRTARRARASRTSSQVCLFGNMQISTPGDPRAARARHPDLVLQHRAAGSTGGRRALDSKNIELRVAQHRAAQDEASACASRGRSSRRRSGTAARCCAATPRSCRRGCDDLRRASSSSRGGERRASSLLGMEGTAARSYFGAFTRHAEGGEDRAQTFDLEGRNRRPPRDPVNALLSLAYSLLTKDWRPARSHRGSGSVARLLPSAALRPPGARARPDGGDAADRRGLRRCISALNTGVVTADDFIVIRPAASLEGRRGRRRFSSRTSGRMDQLVTHPVFGYRVSYRRVLEVQARHLRPLCARRDSDAYPEFRTR